MNQKNTMGETALLLATKYDHSDFVAELIKTGADIYIRSGQD